MKQINEKLFIITREDLNPGYQLVQTTHAAIYFSVKYPETLLQWHTQSNYLACLSAKDENHLKTLISKCEANNLKFVVFTEPDVDNQITAIAIEPSMISIKLCSNLPKALKQYNHTLLDKTTYKKEVSNP